MKDRFFVLGGSLSYEKKERAKEILVLRVLDINQTFLRCSFLRLLDISERILDVTQNSFFGCPFENVFLSLLNEDKSALLSYHTKY